ncbi:MAG: hypothetical protein ACE3L7_04260 [Candidatus Pristimantibacillus sp.]
MEWIEPTIEKKVKDVIENINNDTRFILIEQRFSELFKEISLCCEDPEKKESLYQLEKEINVMLSLATELGFRSGLKEGIRLIKSI